MNNKLLSLTYFMALFIALPFLLTHAEERPFKVGVILPLTGPQNFQGVSMKNAIVMAKKDLDPDNGIELIFEDDMFIPKNTVTAAHKLVKQDQVGALIVFGTNQGASIVDFTERNKVPFISININRQVVKNRKYSVITFPALEKLTKMNIIEAKKRGYQKVAIIASQQDSCLLQRKIFEESKLFSIVYSDEIPPQETNVRDYAFKLLSKRPDAIFLSVLTPQGSLFAKALRELGFKGDLFGGLQIANQSELDASQGALLGSWAVSGNDQSATEYYKKYHQLFPETATAESVYAYDSLRLLLLGIKSGNLNNFLHTAQNISGYAGQYSADGQNGFDFEVVAKEFTPSGLRVIN